ncbi:hypothetical protein BIW11_01954 [Tropilaelaps mercedesae]|uniref:Uncharacterized protein n=1 Tax=Tropilaelaps mercedesae TaxID=418985 RepID=A0A1V9X5N2_9ACAR|nr:hypothetical protein BIW11_01954 [Tropilaelaps mercedesae]
MPSSITTVNAIRVLAETAPATHARLLSKSDKLADQLLNSALTLGPFALCALLVLACLSATHVNAQVDRDRAGVVEMVQSLSPEEQLLYDVLVKRPSTGHRYGFGLGKRSPEPAPGQRYQDEPTFSSFKRRQYNFGLGKRPWPMSDNEEYRKRKYNFGLGKRSE